MRRFSSCDHRRRIRARPAIDKLHRVHLSVVDTYPPLPISKPGTDGRLLARAGWMDAYRQCKIESLKLAVTVMEDEDENDMQFLQTSFYSD